MAQPQGLNVPAILLTGIVGCILTATVIEGVRAYYYYTLKYEEESKWSQSAPPLAHEVKVAQQKVIKFEGNIPIDQAMKRIVATGGKLPATKPAGQ